MALIRGKIRAWCPAYLVFLIPAKGSGGRGRGFSGAEGAGEVPHILQLLHRPKFFCSLSIFVVDKSPSYAILRISP